MPFLRNFMISQTKKLLLFAVLGFTANVSLQAMEFTDEYPFNVKHENVSDVHQVGRVMGGYVAGGILGNLMVTIPAGTLMVFYNACYKKTIEDFSHEQLSFLTALGVIYGFVGKIGATLGQIWYCNAKSSLYELVGDKTFLDIIKSDNGIHAKAWLSFYNKARTDSGLPIYGTTAFPAYFAKHATIKNNRGQTALMLAAQHDSINVAKELLAAGADVKATDNEGKTALDYAQKNSAMIDVLNNALLIEPKVA